MRSPRRLALHLLAVAMLAAPSAALTACGDDDGGGGDGGPQQSPQQVVDSGDAGRGNEVYAQNCAVCHGDDGGGGTGPALAGNEEYTDPDLVVPQIREGGGGMPAFEDRLDDQELADVSAFVVQQLAAP